MSVVLASKLPTAPVAGLIHEFDGPYRALSNFAPIPVRWEDVLYPTSEAAFQAAKTLDLALRHQIAALPTPYEAKRAGRALRLRPGWNAMRVQVMREVLAVKFSPPDMIELLLSTGTDLLIEGNGWGDQDWGCSRKPCDQGQPGKNMLGRLLMERRQTLRPELAQRWTRVACTGHRPRGLPHTAEAWLPGELRRVTAKLAAERHAEIILHGAAQGADLWFAEAALATGLRVWSYLPCSEQDARWSEKWKQRRNAVLDASDVFGLRRPCTGSAYHDRNAWLLRDSQALVAIADPHRRTGGTAAAIRAAIGRVPIVYVDVRAQRTTMPSVDALISLYGKQK